MDSPEPDAGILMKQYDLVGKNAIVTGGGTGLGRQIALALASAGANIALAARRKEPLEQTAKEVAELGRQSFVIPTDVTVPQQVERMAQATLDRFGHIDILVNNAGIARGEGSSTSSSMQGHVPDIWEVSDELWMASMAVNLSSAFYCTRAVARHMSERGSGKIINMGSGAGLRAVKGSYTYCTFKAAVIHFTRVAAVSLAERNIQVNCIAPVFVMTGEKPPGVAARRERYMPLKRSGSPEEITGLALYLASSASDYVTGSVFPLDGASMVTYSPSSYAPLSRRDRET